MSCKKIKLSSLPENIREHIISQSGIQNFDLIGKLITPYDKDYWKIKFKGHPWSQGYDYDGYLLIPIEYPYILQHLLAEADTLEELEHLKTTYNIGIDYDPYWKLLSIYKKRKQELKSL